MLAMVVNDNAGNLMPRGVLQSIASNRASTGCSYRVRVISGASIDDRYQLYAKDHGGAQAYRPGCP
ncbi:hypothetical protein AO361_09600 [Pseudomonas fluorescens]|nr:hypothetical protein AO361_09600 [Pseudomonas fluorescens]